ncbi:MAG: sigma-70 family RNA polymerase sigma factor [Clostridiales bacterium]|jgi:RNA polymerase sigma factor (sigma-70 family)|nr:sigma-70 family RNA polymerase sigma factor [Clostridiales bacterium]
MVKIKYFNGKENIEIEVTKEIDAEIAKLDRADGVQKKQVSRHWTQDDCLNEICSNEYNPEYILISKIESQEKDLQIDNLKNAIQQLTQEQQKILKLYYFQDMDSVEMAGYFGVSKQAVQQRIQVILKKLKKYFNKLSENTLSE